MRLSLLHRYIQNPKKKKNNQKLTRSSIFAVKITPQKEKKLKVSTFKTSPTYRGKLKANRQCKRRTSAKEHKILAWQRTDHWTAVLTITINTRSKSREPLTRTATSEHNVTAKNSRSSPTQPESTKSYARVHEKATRKPHNASGSKRYYLRKTAENANDAPDGETQKGRET